MNADAFPVDDDDDATRATETRGRNDFILVIWIKLNWADVEWTELNCRFDRGIDSSVLWMIQWWRWDAIWREMWFNEQIASSFEFLALWWHPFAVISTLGGGVGCVSLGAQAAHLSETPSGVLEVTSSSKSVSFAGILGWIWWCHHRLSVTTRKLHLTNQMSMAFAIEYRSHYLAITYVSSTRKTT